MGSRQRAPATCHEAESPLSRRHGSLSVRHAFERPRRGRGPGPRVESRCPRAPGAAGSGGRRGGLSFQRRVAAAHPRMPRSSDTLQPEIGLAVGSDRRRGAHTWGDAEQEPRRGLKGRGSQKSSARGSGPRSEDQRPGAQPPAFSGARGSAKQGDLRAAPSFCSHRGETDHFYFDRKGIGDPGIVGILLFACTCLCLALSAFRHLSDTVLGSGFQSHRKKTQCLSKLSLWLVLSTMATATTGPLQSSRVSVIHNLFSL